MQRCCRGGVEVQRWCRGAEVKVQVQVQVQSWCRYADMQMPCRCVDVQRWCRGADEQISRLADVQMCRGAGAAGAGAERWC